MQYLQAWELQDLCLLVSDSKVGLDPREELHHRTDLPSDHQISTLARQYRRKRIIGARSTPNHNRHQLTTHSSLGRRQRLRTLGLPVQAQIRRYGTNVIGRSTKRDLTSSDLLTAKWRCTITGGGGSGTISSAQTSTTRRLSTWPRKKRL